MERSDSLQSDLDDSLVRAVPLNVCLSRWGRPTLFLKLRLGPKTSKLRIHGYHGSYELKGPLGSASSLFGPVTRS